MDAALEALADPRRREILRLAWPKGRGATSVVSQCRVTGPASSPHIGALEAGLVTERRGSNHHDERTDRSEADQLGRLLDRYWTDSLDQLCEAAETAQRDKERP